MTPHITDHVKMIDPSITDGWLTVNFKFKIYPGHGKMIDPSIVTDQNVTENFKLKM